MRLETVEKENSQLKYEVHVLNKELEIRSQEREYERKAVDVANKQHLESVKKVAKLEEECTRLRLLVRKKLPGRHLSFFLPFPLAGHLLFIYQYICF